MSDEMNWGREPLKPVEETAHVENTETAAAQQGTAPTQQETKAEESSAKSADEPYRNTDTTYHYSFNRRERPDGRPMEHPYSAGRMEQKQSGQGDGTVPPRYEHYHMHQGQQKRQGDGQPSGNSRSRKSGSGFGKKLGTTVALAVVFGLVAGGVFQGVNMAADKYNVSRTPIGTTETVGDTASTGITADTENAVNKIVAESGTVAGVAQAAMPSVVAITSVSVQEIPSFFGYGVQEYPSTGSGSGIIVGENDKELLIATNNHVVEGATTLSVCFIGKDVLNAEEETQYLASGSGDINIEDAVTAKIKGTDEDNDLAVIAVEKKDIPKESMEEIKIAQLGSSDDLMVGEQVVAIGNALGYGQSVTSGWISALSRTITMDDGRTSEVIQTDAAINPGNSGGALLNMKGELIGINSAKYASSTVEGTGFAIPISKAQPILEDLMNRVTRDKVQDENRASYLGVQVADLSVEAIQMYNMPSGAFVIEVTKGDAAEKAGIQRNDIIMKLDGQKVSGKLDLIDKLQYYEAGENVEMVIARADNGEYKEQTVEVTLGARLSAEN